MGVGMPAGGEASVSCSGDQIEAPKESPLKKKRNQPGMPDPEAEVIALSPKTLMATNRFICEICKKGFQRDQNLQLHRRGHNLPWKLRQRSSKEVVKKRVYVCPHPTCVHHHPSRALGDLTGIKKHFSRKHGDKKWNCLNCSKNYAVHSDWKAHSKICGTRQYKCDCGTLFSRRDSFITHRAFCDALAEETARDHPGKPARDPKPSSSIASPPPVPPQHSPHPIQAAPPPPPPPQATAVVPSIMPDQSSVPESPENPCPMLEEAAAPPPVPLSPPVAIVTAGLNGNICSSTSSGNTSSTVFASLFTSTAGAPSPSLPTNPNPGFSDFIQTMAQPECASTDLPPPSAAETISLCLTTNHGLSIFTPAGQERRYAPPPQPAMSATALLQKAAEIGAAASGGSLLRGLGLVSSTPSPGTSENLPWTRQSEPENCPLPSGLGLGLHCNEGPSLKELMIGSSSMSMQPTLDFLGLGMAAGGSSNGGLPTFIASIGGGMDVAAAAAAAASFQGGDFTGKDIGRSS